MKQKRKPPKPPSKKLFFRASWSSWKLLKEFQSESDLKSMYELGQYIIACFIRYLKIRKGLLEPEEENEYLDDEVQEMFVEFSQAEKHFEYVKPKRRAPQHEVDRFTGQLNLWNNDGLSQT